MDLTSLFERARAAGRELLQLPVERVDEILRAVADEALAQSEYILSENARDLERMSSDNPMYDRLKLTSARLEGIAADTRHVADLPSPLGRVLKHTVLPNGLDLKRVSVPFGVIGVIYEARPNVSFDVFSLCLKAGSACVLKGGSDADFSNRAIVKVIHGVLERFGVTPDVVVLLPAEREATAALLQARGYVDLLIPRGSSALIQYVRENARIPVIETGAMPQAIALLREKGITCLAAALYQSQPLSAAKAGYPGGVCVVIGSEGQGLTDETIAACNSTVRIPMTDRVESLNAGIAGSILLWHFREESL